MQPLTSAWLSGSSVLSRSDEANHVSNISTYLEARRGKLLPNREKHRAEVLDTDISSKQHWMVATSIAVVPSSSAVELSEHSHQTDSYRSLVCAHLDIHIRHPRACTYIWWMSLLDGVSMKRGNELEISKSGTGLVTVEAISKEVLPDHDAILFLSANTPSHPWIEHYMPHLFTYPLFGHRFRFPLSKATADINVLISSLGLEWYYSYVPHSCNNNFLPTQFRILLTTCYPYLQAKSASYTTWGLSCICAPIQARDRVVFPLWEGTSN